MFQYKAMTEQEAMKERFQLLKEGIYDGIISSSNDSISTSGNGMMDMIVTVYDECGKGIEIRDFLVFMPKTMWKIVHFSDSTGLMKSYEDGKLCSELVFDKRVKVKVKIQEGNLIPVDKLNGKASGSKYNSKNVIEDYLPRGDNQQSSTLNDDPFKDDDIPI